MKQWLSRLKSRRKQKRQFFYHHEAEAYRAEQAAWRVRSTFPVNHDTAFLKGSPK